MSAEILDGKKLSEKILAEVAQEVANMKTPPTLAIVLVGEDPASLSYVKQKSAALHT